MIPAIRKLRDTYPLSAWYAQCINHALKNSTFSGNSTFTWMDVGAGNGELALQLTKKYPFAKGLAIDFHNEPEVLKQQGKVDWESKDLNAGNVYPDADFIFLITVLEHVMFPDKIIDALLNSLNHEGRLYITVPDFGSMANRLLKKKWPYFLPGEHLCIPTIKGMQLLLSRKCNEKSEQGFFEINVGKTIIPYPVGYYMEYFAGIKLPGTLANIPLSIPTGLLEASVTLKKIKKH
ncbi:MAG: methyltransferase domain-containing protein [Agriterribacter sp.]